MADFRKWLLVLAVMVAVAVPAAAQSCTLAPANPTNIRDGGLTELVGDMVLQCAGGTTDRTVNVQIFMQGATVSNRVRAGGLVSGTPQCPYTGLSNCVTDSLLLTNDNTSYSTGVAPISGLLQPAVSGTDSPTNRNSILFPAIVIPMNTTTQFRITNVRVVAPPMSTINLGLPTTVVQAVSFVPQLGIQQLFQTVANVLPPMQFTTTSCYNAQASVSPSFRQCISENASLYSSDSGTGNRHFNVKFTEGFALAFKSRGDITVLNVPSALGGSEINLFESGLVLTPSASTPGWDGSAQTGVADTGTILRVNFKNIPQGVKVFVTQDQIPPAQFPVNSGTTAGITATRLSGFGTTVAGTTTCTGGSGDTTMAMMKPNSDNAVAWQITSTGIAGPPRMISFGVAVAFAANTSAQLPALTGDTPMSVTGQLWPSSTVAQASTGDPIPRFRDVQYSSGSVSILPCATTLLYPFTTNKAGFETGIAVINASLDNYNSTNAPLRTPTQTGPCTIYFFDGTTSAPAPVTTPSIVPGGQYVNTISGLAAGAAFQGYLIASCQFQFGHGYAYVTDTSTSKLGAQGYLALVIPDYGTARQPDPFSVRAAGTGEMLAF